MTSRLDAVTRAEATDAELLAAHVSGDPYAFGELVARHRDRLWSVALRTTSDPEEASDALQDALISAFRRADQFRGDSAVTTWLHRIVVNASLDRLRRKAEISASWRASEASSGSDVVRRATLHRRSRCRDTSSPKA